MVGLYYTAEKSREDTWATHTEHPAIAPLPASSPLTGPLSSAILIDSEYRGWSTYGQIDFDFNDALSLTAGIRYTDDKLEGDARESNCDEANGVTASFDDGPMYDRSWREAAGCDANGALLTDNPTQELSETGWKVGLNRHVNDATLAYISASSGFKGGAYDNRAQANGQQPVGPEYLDAYEIGIKTELADNKVQLKASYYWYDWQDLQQFATHRTTRVPLLLNIPSTEMQGLEVELKWAPTETFYLQAGIGFSDNEIAELTELQADPSAVGFETGWDVTNAPATSANLLVVNTIPVETGEIVLQASYRYISEFFYVTDDPGKDNVESDPHSWINARIAYHFGNTCVTVSLFGVTT